MKIYDIIQSWNIIKKYKLKDLYRIRLGEELNLHNPKSFNAKIQWLKLYYKDYKLIICSDKYLVRKFMEKKGFGKYLPKLYAVYESTDEIDFAELPNQFVIKCTHGSGYVILCKDKSKLDINNVISKLNKWMKLKYSNNNSEWFYDVLQPKIIVEELLQNNDDTELIDYKFMCFNGESKIMFLTLDRDKKPNMKLNFYDMQWNRLPFRRHYKNSMKFIKKPKGFEDMINISNILSKDFPFVRVDFYYVNNQIYIGELTFCPGSGFEEFSPSQYDEIIGDMLNLPTEKEIRCKKQQLRKFIKYVKKKNLKYVRIWK